MDASAKFWQVTSASCEHNDHMSSFPINIRRDDGPLPMPEVGDVVRLVIDGEPTALLVSTVTPVVDDEGFEAVEYTFWSAPVEESEI